MDHSMMTAFLRYARKQARAFRKDPPAGAHKVCIGCQWDSATYPSSCGNACLVITRAAEKWQRDMRAAQQVGER